MFSLFCINMGKILCFYTSSLDFGKIEKLMKQEIEGRQSGTLFLESV